MREAVVRDPEDPNRPRSSSQLGLVLPLGDISFPNMGFPEANNNSVCPGRGVNFRALRSTSLPPHPSLTTGAIPPGPEPTRPPAPGGSTLSRPRPQAPVSPRCEHSGLSIGQGVVGEGG